MTKFPTPSQATTVNSLNVVSPAEMQTSLQVKTAIALDDGTPRSFDIKALDSLAHDNQSQLAQVGQQLIQHQQSIIELQAKLAGSQTSPLQDRILAIEQELKRLTNEGMALANQIYIALTSQPKGYVYGQWLGDEQSKSPADLWPNSQWQLITIAGQASNNHIWLSV